MMTSDTMTEEDRGILRDRIARSLSEILSDNVASGRKLSQSA